MKITKLVLKDFHQFKDVEIDLTYPTGHKKEGEPLDKVFIIGQSGTGKTTLLKIIGGHTFTLNSLFNEYNPNDFEKIRVYKKFDGIEVEIKVSVDKKDDLNTYFWNSNKENNRNISFDEAVKRESKFFENIKTHFIFFPADLHYEFESSGSSLATKKVIDFREDKVGDIWNLVFEEI